MMFDFVKRSRIHLSSIMKYGSLLQSDLQRPKRGKRTLYPVDHLKEIFSVENKSRSSSLYRLERRLPLNVVPTFHPWKTICY